MCESNVLQITKARARGPKRRAPASVNTNTIPINEEKNIPEESTVKTKPAVSSPKPQSFRTFKPAPIPTTSPRGVGTDLGGIRSKSTPPATPVKPLSFSRRATVEDDIPSPTNQVLEKVKPPTPAKSPLLAAKSSKLNLRENGNQIDSTYNSPPPPQTPAHKPQSPLSEEPISPTPLPLFSTSSRDVRGPRRLPTPPTTGTAGSKENQRPLPNPPMKPKVAEIEEVQDEEAPVSVKKSAALWGSTNSTPDTTPQRRGPIRLPSYQDEVAAMESSKSAALAANSSNNQHDGSRSPYLQAKQSSPLKEKMTSEPEYQGNVLSDPNQFLAEFFSGTVTSAPDYKIDVQRIINSRPPDTVEKVITLKKTMWEITGINGKKDLVPKGQENVLYEDGLYMCLHAFMQNDGMMASEVYLWSGDKVSSGTVEEAQLSARRLAREHDGRVVSFSNIFHVKEVSNLYVDCTSPRT